MTPQDIKDIGHDILRHRIKATYEAEAENISSEEIINQIFEKVDVPQCYQRNYCPNKTYSA